MPKALFINDSLIQWLNSLTWILSIWTIAYMLIFSCIFNPDVLEFSCLLSGFHSLVKPWRTILKVRSLGNCMWQMWWEEESWAFSHWETSAFSLCLSRQSKWVFFSYHFQMYFKKFCRLTDLTLVICLDRKGLMK